MIFRLVVGAVIIGGSIAAISPIVELPGTGGTQLEAKLDKPSSPHWYCAKTADWYTLWLDAKQLVPGAVECWCDNVQLIYDEEKDVFSNQEGVSVRVPDWGQTTAFESLSPSLLLEGATHYFSKFNDALEDAGYSRGSSIRGAPYDFRYAPPSMESFETELKALVEETYAANDNTPVTMVSHSMGCYHALYFLQQQSQEWKDTYVHAWVPISPAIGGTVNEMKLFATGSSEGIPGVSSNTVRGEQRSYESNAWLLPDAATYGDDVLVSTTDRNYTASDLDAFFTDIDFAVGTKIRARVADLTGSLATASPGVPVYCYYGTGVDTEAFYEYSGSFDDEPVVTMGDGDGTVNLKSLELCKGFSEEVKAFPGETHSGLLDSSELQALVVSVATIAASN
mmetsp:Transcript_32386/g.74918  ORF Transcript_32386/g.74918 Transcript_32386/m.74918 type:complete len:395 (-) Transcript_32386:586-1770(-)